MRKGWSQAIGQQWSSCERCRTVAGDLVSEANTEIFAVSCVPGCRQTYLAVPTIALRFEIRLTQIDMT